LFLNQVLINCNCCNWIIINCSSNFERNFCNWLVIVAPNCAILCKFCGLNLDSIWALIFYVCNNQLIIFRESEKIAGTKLISSLPASNNDFVLNISWNDVVNIMNHTRIQNYMILFDNFSIIRLFLSQFFRNWGK